MKKEVFNLSKDNPHTIPLLSKFVIGLMEENWKAIWPDLLNAHNAVDGEELSNKSEDHNLGWVSLSRITTPFLKYRKALYINHEFSVIEETHGFPVFMDFTLRFFMEGDHWEGECGYEIDEICFYDGNDNECFKILSNYLTGIRSPSVKSLPDRHQRMKNFLNSIFDYAENYSKFRRDVFCCSKKIRTGSNKSSQQIETANDFLNIGTI